MAKSRAGTARKADARDYAAIATRYAREVLDGTIPAGSLLKKRCQQFLDELGKQDWDWSFDRERAARACKFIECLPVTDSKEDRQVRLMPWQVFVVANVFGWVSSRTGKRRFQRAHVWVAAGNGKSFLASAVGLYAAFGEEQKAAEVVCVAKSRKQAQVVFDTAKQMVQFRPDFAQFLGVEALATALVQERTASRFEHRSSEADTLFGMRPYCAIVDEMHVVDYDVYAAVTNRMAKRDESLLLTISTAGYDLSGIGHAVFAYCQKIIEGTERDDVVFTVIYQAESESDFASEEELKKAHPSWGVTVRPDVVLSMAKEATRISAKRYQFVTEQLNRWVSAAEAWISTDLWDACADPDLKLDHFAGRDCIVGVDLAAVSDVASKALVFWDDTPQGRHYYCFWKNYLPEGAVAKNAAYLGWVHDGCIQVTPGDATDFGFIREDVVEDCQRFNVQNVIIDQWNASHISQELMDRGVPVVLQKMGSEKQNFPMKVIEAAVVSGRLHHAGDPAVRWMFGNVQVKPSGLDNVRLWKEARAAKIDAAAALVCALSGLQEEPVNVWKPGGISAL